MELKRTYLKIAEIGDIVDQMMSGEGAEFSYNRELIKVALVAKCCVDYDFGGMLGDEIYDLMAENNMIERFEMDVVNYYVIDKLLKEERSVESTIIRVAEHLNKKIDEVLTTLPQEDSLDDIIKTFGGILEKKNDGI